MGSQRRQIRSSSLVATALFVASGCADRFDPQGGEHGDCDQGAAGCACLDGLCQFGLSCDSGVCIDHGNDDRLPPPDTDGDEVGDDDGSEGPGDSGGSSGSSGSCFGHCSQGVPDGDGMCFCTPTCAGLGTCCADYEEACPVPAGCATNNECSEDEVCSASTHECVPAYGTVFDVYVHFEDTSGMCWDADECAPDPFFKAWLMAADCNGGGEEIEIGRAYYYLVNTYVADWAPPFAHAVEDGQTLAIGVWDMDIESQSAQGMACCAWTFDGVQGENNLNGGELVCTGQGRLLTATFVAQ